MITKIFNAKVLYPVLERRLGRNIRPKIKTLKAEHNRPADARMKLQREMLFDILTVAQNDVPYYRSLFKKIGFDPREVLDNPKALKDLPYLTKDILLEEGTRLVNEKMDSNSLLQCKTGGSTGACAIIYYDQEAADWAAAVNLFALTFAGRSHLDTEVHLSTRFPEEHHWKARLREWAKCQAMNRVNLLTDSFDDKSMAQLWKQLRKVRPYIVQGHPSTLYALAIHVEKNGPQDRGAFKAFESTGETLDQKKLQAIESSLGCKAYNRFGNAEFGVVAHSRESTTLLEFIDYIAYPETFDLGNGLEEIVLTGLTNKAMPLIRYRTGDLGSLETIDDRVHIRNIQGRIHDIISIGSKTYPSHWIQDMFGRTGGVDEFQLVHRPDGQIPLLKIIPSIGADRAQIERRAQQMFGDDVEIEFTNFDGLILKGWRDKFRYVVNQA